MFNIGDTVRVVDETYGFGHIEVGDIGTVIAFNGTAYIIDLPNNHHWMAAESDLELIRKKGSARRKAKKLVPKDYRQQVAVRLIKKVTEGEGKFTAVKVESEGNMQRTDRCTDRCTMRTERRPHVGCQYFRDNRVANDFILRELAKQGLAKRCQRGENNWGYLYMPCLPLVFSKVYNDSETEWTTTLLLKEATDVLYTPYLVDAFNALIAANGNGVNVLGSGMHTAFIQGKDGMYPSDNPSGQHKLFENYAKSMRPLLPALYLLGANRMENGKGITRSTSPRLPLISDHEKYSAIAYRYGAVEFRVFDTCYDNREQLLDNIVVMAQSITKYWHKDYVKPAATVDKPVYFGTAICESNSKNAIESLYVVKEHIVLLNKGLRCIKPPYMTVKDVKRQRNFKLTVRSLKDTINLDSHRPEYDRQLKQHEVRQMITSAREFYDLVNELRYRCDRVPDLAQEYVKLRAKADERAKKNSPIPSLEEVAYRATFKSGFSLGEV